MDSIEDLVDLLKDGRLSREQVLERVASASLKNPSRPSSSIAYSGSNIESAWDPQDSLVNYCDDEVPRKPPQKTPQASEGSSLHSFERFYERQGRYETIKTEKLTKWRQQLDDESGRECTFEPQVHQAHSPIAHTIKRLSQTKDYSMYEALKTDRDRAKEQAALQECTFHPKVNSPMGGVGRSGCSSRNLSATRAKAERHFQQVCTFKPKILGITPMMSQASLYTKESAFDRLYNKSELQTPGNSTAADSRMHSVEASLNQAEREESLNDFYLRQHRFLEAKQSRLEERSKEPDHKPKLCERSTQLAKGTFEQRNLDLLKKRKDLTYSEIETTFTPKISSLAKASRHRSVEEMCYGDAEKKQKKLDDLKKLYEDQEARSFQMTFVEYPSAVEASSKLRLLDDSETYLDRIQEARELKAGKAEKERFEREAKELVECTHMPEILEAPAFVKRVAHSMALLKAQRHLDELEKPRKPDWR